MHLWRRTVKNRGTSIYRSPGSTLLPWSSLLLLLLHHLSCGTLLTAAADQQQQQTSAQDIMPPPATAAEAEGANENVKEDLEKVALNLPASSNNAVANEPRVQVQVETVHVHPPKADENQQPVDGTKAAPPQEEEKIPVVSADHSPAEGHPPNTKKNYASKDCGAKVLYSNEEAENRGAILNDPERDDYMRNPCDKHKFLIIELCETIQATSLEIANFELFSSSPKEFRLWGTERYPTQDWTLIGEFEAQNNREVQSFQVEGHTSYAKFVKLELLTHHGKEHFCTLSTFCLYGTSMVDEYEAEVNQLPTAPPIVEPILLENAEKMGGLAQNVPKKTIRLAGKEEDPLYEDYENNTNRDEDGAAENNECNINDGAKREFPIKTTTQSKNGDLITEDEIKHTITENKQNVSKIEKEAEEPMNGTTIVPKGEDRENGQQKIVPTNMLEKIVQIGNNLKHVLGQAFSNKDAGKRNGTVGRGANSTTISLGNRPTGRTHFWRRYKSPSAFCQTCSPNRPSQCNKFCRVFFFTPSAIAEVQKNKSSAENLIGRHSRQVKINFLDTILPPKSLQRQICVDQQRAPPRTCGLTGGRKTKDKEKEQQQELVQLKEERKELNDKTQQTQAQQQNGGNTGGDTPNIDGSSKQPPQKPVQPNRIGDKANIRPLPGTSTTHKESVFMKLNKRLTALEQNLSWSSEHISEMGRLWGLKEEEMKERIMKTAVEVARRETQKVAEQMQNKMNELQKEVKRLAQQLQSVSTLQASTAGNGFFYRPFIGPFDKYVATESNAQCFERACLNNGLSPVSPLHSTSSPYGTVQFVSTQHLENGPTEGLWTTTQVVYLVLFVQMSTWILMRGFRLLYNRLLSNRLAAVPSTASNLQVY